MTPAGGVAATAAGLAAGIVNTIVGSGSLITFPTLLALGYAPVLANVSNSVGLAPGSVSGAVGYRRELAGQGRRMAVLGGVSLVGSIAGGLLLLGLPSRVFRSVVPVLVLIAVVLMAAQPRIASHLHARRGAKDVGVALTIAVFVVSVYGGYFGAAQGVLLIALLASLLADELQRLNALKNVLQAVVNIVVALLFIAVTHVAWAAAGCLALGAVVGGQIGAHAGRRLHPGLLRWVVIVVGVGAAIWLFVR